MKTPEELQAINDRIAELEAQKNNLPLELEEFKRQLDLRKQAIRVELNALKKKVAWYKYGQKHYILTNHDNDIAVQMFGKRLKDLSPEETREYNRVRAQESRKRRRKPNDNHNQ